MCIYVLLIRKIVYNNTFSYWLGSLQISCKRSGEVSVIMLCRCQFIMTTHGRRAHMEDSCRNNPSQVLKCTQNICLYFLFLAMPYLVCFLFQICTLYLDIVHGSQRGIPPAPPVLTSRYSCIYQTCHLIWLNIIAS